MSQNQIVTLMQDSIFMILMCSMPMVAVALVIGIIISIFQAATQINEQTMAFAPKIVAILVVLILSFSWILTKLSDFTVRVYSYINQWIV